MTMNKSLPRLAVSNLKDLTSWLGWSGSSSNTGVTLWHSARALAASPTRPDRLRRTRLGVPPPVLLLLLLVLLPESPPEAVILLRWPKKLRKCKATWANNYLKDTIYVPSMKFSTVIITYAAGIHNYVILNIAMKHATIKIQYIYTFSNNQLHSVSHSFYF